MNIPLISKIAKNHLLSRIKQPIVAALGVMFGIGTFIVLVSFMTGLNALLDGLVLNRTPHIHIYNEIEASEIQPIERKLNPSEIANVYSVKPKRNLQRIANVDALQRELLADEKVRGISPQVSAQAFYMAGDVALNGIINGIDIQQEMELFSMGDYIVAGDPTQLNYLDNGIIIGKGVADKLLVDIGDRIQITTPNGGVFNLKIIGFYQSGLAEIDNIQSYVNIKRAQILLGEKSNYITDLNVKLHDMDDAPEMSRLIESYRDISAVTIQEANAQFETGTSIRNLITYAVSVTLLVVAGFGIYNILNMLIYEKMNDIAILKATGYTGADVQWIFIFQALLIGIVGGALGLLLGFGLSVLISQIPFETEALPTVKTYPVNFSPRYYVIGIVFALVSTFFAGYLPSRKARSIDPVEILRGQ